MNLNCKENVINGNSGLYTFLCVCQALPTTCPQIPFTVKTQNRISLRLLVAQCGSVTKFWESQKLEDS